MKLYMRTPAGAGFGIDVMFTGRIREATYDGVTRISAVEIALPIEVDFVMGYTVEPLDKSPSGLPLWWADPGDICADDGGKVTREQLRTEAERVRELRDKAMQRGPLPKNWP